MDGYFLVILLLPIIAAIGWSLQAASLQSKFSRMGTLRGRTRNEIIAAAGQPNSVSSIGPNQTLMQWQTTGYHIALTFTGEMCNGISHEYSIGGSSCAQSEVRDNSGYQAKKQLDYERKYQEEKELYERTGKVSDWNKEGRALFDFEIRAKQLLEQQEKRSKSNETSSK